MCRKKESTLYSGVFRQNLDKARPRQVRSKYYVAGSSRLFLAFSAWFVPTSNLSVLLGFPVKVEATSSKLSFADTTVKCPVA